MGAQPLHLSYMIIFSFWRNRHCPKRLAIEKVLKERDLPPRRRPTWGDTGRDAPRQPHRLGGFPSPGKAMGKLTAKAPWWMTAHR